MYNRPVPSQKAMAPTGHLAHVRIFNAAQTLANYFLQYDKVSELAYAQRSFK